MLSDLNGLSQMIKQSAQDSLYVFANEGWKHKVIYPHHTVERKLRFSAQIFWSKAHTGYIGSRLCSTEPIQ